MKRQFFYHESLPARSTSSTFPAVQVLSMSFYPDENSTYICLASALVNISSAISSAEFELFENTRISGPTISQSISSHDGANYFSVGGMAQMEYTSPTALEEQIGFFHKAGGGGGLSTIKEMRCLVVKLHADDYFVEGSGVVTSSTTPQEAASLTITEDGDYLVFAYGRLSHNNTGTSGVIKLSHNSTDYDVMNMRPGATADFRPWMSIKKITATAGDTLKVYGYSLTANTTTVDGPPRIWAMNLGTVDNSYYAESLGRSTTISGSFQDKVSLTETPLKDEHLVAFNALIDNQTTTDTTEARGLLGSADKHTSRVEPWLGSGNDDHSFFVVSKESLENASLTTKLQFRKIGGVIAAGITDGSIAIVQLTGTGSVKFLGKTKSLGKLKIL